MNEEVAAAKAQLKQAEEAVNKTVSRVRLECKSAIREIMEEVGRP